MSGRPVQLFAAATIAAAASLFSISAASANCYSCGPSVVYQAPVVSYSAPVAYSYSYSAPVAYPAPVQYSPGCGCAAQAPMYVVNQGPAFTDPVPFAAEETPAYQPGGYPLYSRGYGYRGYGYGYRSYGYGHRAYGYRGYGARYGYRGYGHRGLTYRGYGYRHGAGIAGARYSMRHPMVGLGGVHRGGMNRMHGMNHPMMGRGGMNHPMVGRGGMHRGPQHAGGAMHPRQMGPRPGAVNPVGAPKKMP